ncbi:MAG: rRNA maturation RNase YbeY [Bacteroidales bacterium]|nr:rRNA maturation RNase YbeY [Bacteroidales bacterium]MDD6184951.1 rRNA maturation RNase YbeY [Bacteroidales bacterium]
MVSFEYNCEMPLRLSLKHKVWLQQVVRKEGKVTGDISYVFCDDAYMLQQNNAFLQHDTYTDIITFDECVGDVISGSILISADRVAENASKFGKTFENELLRVVVHGTLHLCGYKDKSESEAKLMRQKEDESLALFTEMTT